MKVKVEEFSNVYYFVLDPENVNEASMLLRLASTRKANSAYVTTHFAKNIYSELIVRRKKDNQSILAITNKTK